MQLQTQLDCLQFRLVEALRSLPGATVLYLFGSRAGGMADQYSDIDLQVFTVDAAISRSVWPQFLELVGPIHIILPLGQSCQNTSFTVVFRGESPYHKVDIGISPVGDPLEQGLYAFPHIKIWSQAPAPVLTRPMATKAYMPDVGTNGYLVIDELIGCIRYAKARKRGHDLMCWRFLRGMPDRLLQLNARRQQPRRSLKTPLTTGEYKALNNALPPSQRVELIRHLDWSSSRGMDSGCLWFAQQIVSMLMEDAAKERALIPQSLVDELLGFIRKELDVNES